MIYYIQAQRTTDDWWTTLEREGQWPSAEDAMAVALRVKEAISAKAVRVVGVSEAWYPPGEPVWRKEEL